jgi:hypothetical protein
MPLSTIARENNKIINRKLFKANLDIKSWAWQAAFVEQILMTVMVFRVDFEII